MSEDYLPSDVADRATADHNEASWNYLHTNDFGPDVPYNDAYGFGTGQDLANVELAGGIGQATMYGGTPQGTATPVPQYSSNGYLQTNFPENNSFGHVQAQEGTSNAADQYPSDEDQIWRDHEALSNFQNMAGGNGQEQFLNDFNTEPWNTFQPLAGSEGFPEPAHPVYYEPNMHRNFNNTLNPSPARVDSGQPRTINRPEMTSAHGNATMSSGRPRGPTPAKSNSLGKTPHHSRFGNMQGASGDRYPPARAVAENYAATHNGNIDESDDENQGNEEDEDSEEGDVPNYVTFETYEENDPMIVQNPLQDGRGRTGTRNGHQVWFNPRSSKWQPSVYHHDLRPTLIARAQAEYPNDRYRFPDPTDGLPHGETSFFKPHQNRGPDRQDYPDILFKWRESQPKDADGNAIRRQKPKYIRNHPGFMYEGDRIVLDPHDNPVVDHKFIPLTLSAHTTGAKLQEMYLSPDCRQVDLWARMPRWERMKDKEGNLVTVELRRKNTRINMPMLRFREKKGTIAGEDREGSDVIREGLLQIYRENGFDPVAAGNSTKGFWRDLKGFEVKAVKLRNTANFAKRAGNRAIPEEQRQENLEKTKASIENGKRKRALENGDNTGYRPRDQGADVEVTGHAPNKRVYKEPVFAPSQIRAPANSVRGNAGESSRQGLRSKASMAVNQQPVTQQRAYQQQAYQQLAYQQQAYQQPEFQQPVHQQLVHQQPQLVMNPYHLNGRPDTQRGPGQSYLGQAPTTSSYVPQHLPHQGMERGSLNMPPPASGQGYGFQSPNNGYALPQTFGKQTQGGLDESEYDPYVIGENRQRIVRQGKIDEFARANMVPKRPMPSTNSGYSVPSHVSNLHPGSAVERQAPFEGTNGAMKPNGNTLGPGGHQTYQAPKQVLGKRRQQGGNVTAPNQYPESRISTTSDRVQQEEVVGQAIPDPQVGPSQKRPRKNETAGPAPKPQHRRRGGKTPQPKRYGPGGAPEPILLPQEPLESLNPTPDIIENAEGRFRSAGEVYEEMAPTFGFDGSGNYYGNNGDMLDQKTVLEFNWDAAGRDLDLDHLQQPRVDEPEPHAYQAPQVEEEDLNPPQQPHMDEPEPNVHQAPEVEDEHPSPPQQPDVDEPEINAHQAPQVEDNHLTPPLLNENDDAPQVADAQGPDPPSGPSPAPADQDAPFDIRDVRPTDGWQSQSLRNALNYTREAYFEWTGNEVPITTNLEHSYNMQYREIELAFENWWTSGDNPDRVEPIPELYRMKAWSGSVVDWKVPESFEHLWEAMRRGKFASRNADGSLQEPQFHYNAENYEWYDAEVVEQL